MKKLPLLFQSDAIYGQLPTIICRLSFIILLLVFASLTNLRGDEPKSLAILTWNIESPGMQSRSDP